MDGDWQRAFWGKPSPQGAHHGVEAKCERLAVLGHHHGVALATGSCKGWVCREERAGLAIDMEKQWDAEDQLLMGEEIVDAAI